MIVPCYKHMKLSAPLGTASIKGSHSLALLCAHGWTLHEVSHRFTQDLQQDLWNPGILCSYAVLWHYSQACIKTSAQDCRVSLDLKGWQEAYESLAADDRISLAGTVAHKPHSMNAAEVEYFRQGLLLVPWHIGRSSLFWRILKYTRKQSLHLFGDTEGKTQFSC